jgi:hypothetical protein
MIEFALFVAGALVCGGVGWGACAWHYRQLWRYTVADLDADGQAAEAAERLVPEESAEADPDTSQWARDLMAEIETWNLKNLVASGRATGGNWYE